MWLARSAITKVISRGTIPCVHIRERPMKHADWSLHLRMPISLLELKCLFPFK